MRPRRGSVAVEFAVSLPVIFVLLVGVIEWGWYLHREVGVIQAVRDGALAGSVHVDPEAAEGVAVDRADAALAAAGFDPGAANTVATISSTAEGDVILVTTSLPYTSMLKLLPTPATLAAESTFRLVVQ